MMNAVLRLATVQAIMWLKFILGSKFYFSLFQMPYYTLYETKHYHLLTDGRDLNPAKFANS